MKDNLVTIGKYLNYLEAEVIKTRLESEGIECYVTDLSSNIIAGTPYAIEHRLQVWESDVEKAKEILGQKPIELDENSDIAEGEDLNYPAAQEQKGIVEILADKKNSKLFIVVMAGAILLIYLLIKLII
ncbi:MAG: DUF2007 domain-containing protein [bacterium]|nr:DUF2007 domain-containing protein [bacterium]